MSTDRCESVDRVQPISIWHSAAIFLAFGVMVQVSFLYLMPLLEKSGYGHLLAFTVAYGVPTAVMFATAIGLYHQVDGYPMVRNVIALRMWYPSFRMKYALVGTGVFLIAGLISAIVMVPFRDYLIARGVFHLPAQIPFLLDPNAKISVTGLDAAAGGSLVGRWDIAAIFLLMYFFNIAGEELLWRGYLLPRQVAEHGKFAWLVHGLLWAGFHFFKWWDIIVILPLCLLFAYVSQRMKNNWPTLIAHALGNLSFVVLVVGRVAGFIH